MKRLDWIIVLVVALIYGLSGIDKIAHYNGFVNALQNYVLVPRGLAFYMAVPIIAIELMIAAGLLVPMWRIHAALTAALTTLAFTIALVFNHLYGERGICGCWFTITLARGTTMHIMQNIALTLLALLIWWEARKDMDRGHALDC